MRCVLAATAAELAELQTLSRGLLVLSRYVIATFAISALQHNIVTRHKSPSVLCKFVRCHLSVVGQSPLLVQLTTDY